MIISHHMLMGMQEVSEWPKFQRFPGPLCSARRSKRSCRNLVAVHAFGVFMLGGFLFCRYIFVLFSLFLFLLLDSLQFSTMKIRQQTSPNMTIRD